MPPQVKDPTMVSHVRASLIGCRVFYGSIYAMLYIAVTLYPSQLTDSWQYALLWYLPITILALVFFINSGSNPGFVEGPEDEDIELGSVSKKYEEVLNTESEEVKSLEHIEKIELPT